MTQDTQMTGDLLPCPFCGGEAELDTAQAYRALSGGKIGDRATVYCLKCSADMGFCYEDAPGTPREDIVNQVVDDWNRRSALEPAPAPALDAPPPVTRQEALKFLEGACRNWATVPRLSNDDLDDVATELTRFRAARAKQGGQ